MSNRCPWDCSKYILIPSLPQVKGAYFPGHPDDVKENATRWTSQPSPIAPRSSSAIHMPIVHFQWWTGVRMGTLDGLRLGNSIGSKVQCTFLLWHIPPLSLKTSGTCAKVTLLAVWTRQDSLLCPCSLMILGHATPHCQFVVCPSSSPCQ